MREYAPWEYERCGEVEVTDARATLTGGYTPMVRHPVGRLSGSSFVLGMGDVVVANDPVCGQGANNACHCADVYFRSILEHGRKPFSPEWMQQTFDAYWDYARWPTAFTTMMLGPLPEHVQRVLGVASQNPVVARRWAETYADPTDLENWLLDAGKTDAYLASVAGEPAP
jgi:hypothetical protein